MRNTLILASLVLAAFGTYSIWVVAGHGYTGFLTLAGREPWAMQMLLDIVIACTIGTGWMVRDARKHGIAAWPFMVVTLFLGSLGLLAYIVRRDLAKPSARHEPAAAARRA
jgi:hypothetical protein